MHNLFAIVTAYPNLRGSLSGATMKNIH